MVRKDTIYSFSVSYEENAQEGARYLKEDLAKEEAMVFFDYAKRNGSAQFEDDDDRQFTLLYQEGSYVIIRRE
ncbi:hypothetical protein C4553_00365 [Candidatus Parcubacteria bacterium]|nr:MAG: hypothetical protein C4553_00365 [Candidatus Parcubacteria bacterium]